ncbi:hypothetical protein DFH09DRAFT_912165 [Mycena vulgaris]|nr:hypothetical protein DFH09DRAFT_912165 [Mycena vulgaris]
MNECMPSTRVGILAELMAWATDPDGPPVYLITGMAGAGKSAIARSFSRLLDRQMLLGASFFCSRGSEARSNVGGIIPSLAFHLAWRSEPLGRALISTIKMNPGTTFTLRDPEFHSANSDGAQLLVIIIDALDEYFSVDAVQTLLKVLIHSRGVRLKFFITSRPEPYIKTAFHSEVVSRHLRLRDVEHDIVTADIAKYLGKHLREIGSAIHAPMWPFDPDLDELVLRIGDLFIFAFTAIQYLEAKSRSGKEVQRRLQNIPRGTSPTTIQTAVIDTQYAQIIENVWNGTKVEEKTARRLAVAA